MIGATAMLLYGFSMIPVRGPVFGPDIAKIGLTVAFALVAAVWVLMTAGVIWK